MKIFSQNFGKIALCGVVGNERTSRGLQGSPTDKKQWIVDEEAAAVVKWIFDLCIAGKGPMQIGRTLKTENVLCIRAYHAKQKGNPLPENPYQ